MAEEARNRRAEVIGRWLAAAQESVAASLPESTGNDPKSEDAAQDRVRVDSHLVAAECPASHFAPQDDFVENARTAAREVALEALRRTDAGNGSAGGASALRDPVGEVRATLSDPTVFRPGLSRWLLGADRAETAAVAAAATSWMVDALALAARRGEPEWHSPRHRQRHLGAAPVTLSARVDASRATKAGNHLLVLSPGTRRTDARLARHVALVSAVAYGEIPPQVHLGHRDTLSRHSHAIDEAELETAVEELSQAAVWRLRPSTAPRKPGRGCRWCSLAPDCPEGSAHLIATRGSPLPGWLVPDTTVVTGEVSVPEPGGQESSAAGAEPRM